MILISLIFLPTPNHQQRHVEKNCSVYMAQKKTIAICCGIIRRKLWKKIATCSPSLREKQIVTIPNHLYSPHLIFYNFWLFPEVKKTTSRMQFLTALDVVKTVEAQCKVLAKSALFPTPLYSPYLIHCDFWLFSEVKRSSEE